MHSRLHPDRLGALAFLTLGYAYPRDGSQPRICGTCDEATISTVTLFSDANTLASVSVQLSSWSSTQVDISPQSS